MQSHFCWDLAGGGGLTILCAGDLGEDTEGARLGGARAWTPVFSVLHDAFSAGVTVSGHVVESNVCLNDWPSGDPVYPAHQDKSSDQRRSENSLANKACTYRAIR